MFCPNCGKQIEDGSTFCPECGSNLAGGNAPAAPGNSLIPGANVVPANYLTYGASLAVLIGVFLPFISYYGLATINAFGSLMGKGMFLMAIAQIVLISLPQTVAVAKKTNLIFAIISAIGTAIIFIVNIKQGSGWISISGTPSFGFFFLIAASIFWIVAALKYKKEA